MNEFTFTYPTKVYFGKGIAKKALKSEIDKIGKTVMLAYGGGSVKANGIYDEMKGILEEAGNIDPVLLERLRGECVKEVKRLNGSFSFDDAVSWQKGWEENE
ncbi:MAG TPA: iron-containing alcohol dehydrogenase [Candidatus Mediterraneibacter pullistercoris]|nr:iron-containing alcohol dehydrogenase [Candidatus Mediterraneibacter pullistercoris]